MRIVAIVGSREFPRTEYNKISELISQLPPDAMVIVTNSLGVEKYAIEQALGRGLKTRTYEPDWHQYGKRAPFRLNSQLVSVADEVVCALDSLEMASKKSLDLMTKARQEGKQLTLIRAKRNECPCHTGGEPVADFEGEI